MDLASGNKSHVLTKMVVISAYNAVQTQNHCVSHEIWNVLLGQLFLLPPSFITNKNEILEEKLIIYD